jgi:predicted PurR-regulated permease PerM
MNNNNAHDGSRKRLLGRITALLWVVVIALAVTFFYFARSLRITILLAAFLAILVEPLVAFLERFHLPRSASAFSTAGPFLIIVLTVASLHLASANLLIPKFIGSRVNIGPVAATVGRLFWSWLWGAIGLLLAVPLTGFVKLVAHCHPALLPISNLLAETPRPVPRWAQAGRATVTIPYLP